MWWMMPLALAADDPPPEIVVSASRSELDRRDAAVLVERIDREQIVGSGAETLAEVLEEHPGLQVQRRVVGTEVRMQGMNPEHTLVLIDGQRVLGRKDGVVDLSRLSVDDIERIEIVKGPSSSLYGSDAMGGVIHIITRDPEPTPSASLHLRAGTPLRMDGRAEVEAGRGAVSGRASAAVHRSAAWDLDPSDLATTASAVDQQDVDVALRWRPDSADRSVDLSVSAMTRDLDGVDTTAAGAVIDRRQRQQDLRVAGSGWWTPTEDTTWSARASTAVFRDQLLMDQRRSDRLDRYESAREWMTETGVQREQRWAAHQLTVGLEGFVQDLETPRLSTGKASRTRGSAFAEDRWTRGGWTLVPGVRVDADSQFGTVVAPRLATLWSGDAVSLRTSVGRGFRAPDFREQFLLFENPGAGYVIQGNPSLRAERSWGANTGLTWTPTDAWELTASGFLNDVRDLIDVGAPDLETGLQVFHYANVDHARTAGGELQLQRRGEHLDLGVGYTLTHARDVSTGSAMDGRVPHRVAGRIDAQLPAELDLHVRGGWSSPQTWRDPSAAPFTGSVWTTDVRLSRHGERFDVFAGVDNLLNQQGGGLVPLMPRFIYLGADVRWTRPSTEEDPS